MALERTGYPPVAPELLAACNGPSYDEAAALVGVPPEDRARFYQARLQAELEIIPAVQKLFPGIREALERLQSIADMVIVSNGLEAYLKTCLQVFQLDRMFLRVEPWQQGRSKTQALQEALRATQPERCLMIGDRAGDIGAARACGIPCVCAAYGYGDEKEAALADAAANTVSELEQILEAFISKGTLSGEACG